MTDEELKAMKERIAAAEAVRILESKEPRQILLTLNSQMQPIRQRQSDDQRFINVCWSDSEKGLHDELFEAVLNVVRARCEKAIAEWRAI